MDRDNLPNAREVDSQVVVHQDIPESGDGAPIDLGMKSFKVIGIPLESASAREKPARL
jgi:hypothetical protein